MRKALIALGGNLGDPRQTFQLALDVLEDGAALTVEARSGLYLTPAIGDDAGDAFHNAAALITTSLPALELLNRLQAVETALGRVRDLHWGPRTLDLDLVCDGDEVIRHSRLTTPHPACWRRRFVLDPVAEIAGDWMHPEKKRTFRELRERLLPRPLSTLVAGGTATERESIVRELRSLFGPADLSIEPIDDSDRSSTTAINLNAAALILWLGPSTPPRDAAATNAQKDDSWSALPELSRIDLTSFPEDAPTAARYVIASAIDAPLRLPGEL